MPDFSFTSSEFKTNPYAYYAQLRDEAPVFHTQLPDGTAVYLVSRYADVLAGLKDPRLVKNIAHTRLEHDGGMAQMMSNVSMLRADPPEHTRLRALAHEAFTPKFVNQLREHIQAIADRLVDAVEDRGQMDLINDFAFLLPITVICEMLGVPTEDAHQFRAWTSAMIANGTLSSESPQMVPETMQLVLYLQRLINERRASPQSDLISALLQARDHGDQLSERELLGTTVLLLVAGHETTVNLIGNGIFALLQSPQQFEQLKCEPALMRDAVEELLRMVNPVQSVNRFAAEDLVIARVQIPQGSHLLLLLAAADHDAAIVEAAETLDVERNNAKHVAFGQGIHHLLCLSSPMERTS